MGWSAGLAGLRWLGQAELLGHVRPLRQLVPKADAAPCSHAPPPVALRGWGSGGDPPCIEHARIVVPLKPPHLPCTWGRGCLSCVQRRHQFLPSLPHHRAAHVWSPVSSRPWAPPAPVPAAGARPPAEGAVSPRSPAPRRPRPCCAEGQPQLLCPCTHVADVCGDRGSTAPPGVSWLFIGHCHRKVVSGAAEGMWHLIPGAWLTAQSVNLCLMGGTCLRLAMKCCPPCPGACSHHWQIQKK